MKKKTEKNTHTQSEKKIEEREEGEKKKQVEHAWCSTTGYVAFLLLIVKGERARSLQPAIS